MTLPSLQLDATLQGTFNGTTVFVSNMRVRSFITLEAPQSLRAKTCHLPVREEAFTRGPLQQHFYYRTNAYVGDRRRTPKNKLVVARQFIIGKHDVPTTAQTHGPGP